MAEKQQSVGNKTQYDRPSDRIFRRSRAAEQRRYNSQQAESRFLRAIFGLTSLTTLIVFVIIVLFYKSNAQAAETPVPDAPLAEPSTALTEPLFGSFTGLDILGIAIVMMLGYAVWRKYQNKD